VSNEQIDSGVAHQQCERSFGARLPAGGLRVTTPKPIVTPTSTGQQGRQDSNLQPPISPTCGLALSSEGGLGSLRQDRCQAFGSALGSPEE
jgi:hypothetical protein